MNNYKTFTYDQKKEFWSKHIRHFETSGLSQKKYCEQKNISYWSFRTWYYKTQPDKMETKFIRLENPRTSEKPISRISMSLCDKIRIEFDENIPEEILRKIFRASEVLND
jgi:hypothetical protein